LAPFGQAVSEEKIFLTVANQKKELLLVAMFVGQIQQIWLPRAILVSDWLMLNKSSPLKLLGQMEPNLAGSIYVRYSIKLLHMVPFGQQKKELLLVAMFVGLMEPYEEAL
jgi:hypothetical protein